MSFFDDSHVTNGSLQGSLGPSVGFMDMVRQGFQQQFRVDSALALNNELRNRWLENLRNLNKVTGQRFDEPVDAIAYRHFAEYTRGQPVTGYGTGTEGTGYGARFVEVDPMSNANMQAMLKANEAIKKLNNSDVKTFEEILEEVSAMQQEVEGKTVSMYERSGAGGVAGSLIGAIGGSFTFRDPVNIITAPIGVGRTVATRIAAEMGIAAAVVGTTEMLDVAPARRLANLPERNPIFNIAAAAVGAGVIRGGIEGAGYGIRRLRSGGVEEVDFDLRDSQLAQLFEANEARPTARAGAQALDDIQLLERSNPYGDGRAAQVRFLEELRQVQRVMGGEPMTAIARALPPIPFDQLKKVGDFELVKEQAPQVYARMEAAQARLAEFNEGEAPGLRLFHGSNREDLNIDDIEVIRAAGASKQAKDNGRTYGGFYATKKLKEAEGYAAMAEGKPSIYQIDLKPGAKIAEHSGDITRLPPKVIKEYRDKGFDVVVGKDPRGRVEYAIINPEAISKFGRRAVTEQPPLPKALSPEERADIEQKIEEGTFTGEYFEGYPLWISRPGKDQSWYDVVYEHPAGVIVATIDPVKGGKAKISIDGAIPNQLGPAAVRRLAIKIEQSIPDIGGFEGMRTTGARAGKRLAGGVHSQRQVANAEYQAAYREVEAEAARIRERQKALEAAQQREAAGIFADAVHGRTFNAALLMYDNVQARVDAINAFNDTLDERAVAAFVRQIDEADVERAAWQTENGIDIGLREPVDPEFRIATDDGEITIAAAMRDLQNDADLDAAMRTCLL